MGCFFLQGTERIANLIAEGSQGFVDIEGWWRIFAVGEDGGNKVFAAKAKNYASSVFLFLVFYSFAGRQSMSYRDVCFF